MVNILDQGRLFSWRQRMTGIREKKKQATRKAILEAAVRLFSEKGFENTRIEELAQAAGIGKGTIYSYFKTKNDILFAFCEDGIELMHQEYRDKADPDAPLLEQLMTIFKAEFSYVCKNREFGRLYMQETFFPEASEAKRHRELDNKYFDLLFPILERAKMRGELRQDTDLLHITGHFYGIYLMALSAWYTGHLKTQEAVFEGLSTVFLQAMEGLAPNYEKK